MHKRMVDTKKTCVKISEKNFKNQPTTPHGAHTDSEKYLKGTFNNSFSFAKADNRSQYKVTLNYDVTKPLGKNSHNNQINYTGTGKESCYNVTTNYKL